MRILIACEFSQIVTKAFRAKGHDAYSCDLLPTDGNPDWHYQCDVLDILDNDWDMLIGHPECTYLANSGVQHLHKDITRWPKLFEGAGFFKALMDSEVPRICIENPIMHKYAKQLIGRNQSQVIQPWWFGHPEQKATCLWLKNLPLLHKTNDVKAKMMLLPKRERERLHYLPPSPDRWKLRSTTYAGLGRAMANQWSDIK